MISASSPRQVVRVTILSLTGVAVTSSERQPSSSTSDSTLRGPLHHPSSSTVSSSHPTSSSSNDCDPVRKHPQLPRITATVSFSGSCPPEDMHIPSSSVCGSSGRPVVDSLPAQPLAVEGGDQRGVEVKWWDAAGDGARSGGAAPHLVAVLPHAREKDRREHDESGSGTAVSLPAVSEAPVTDSSSLPELPSSCGNHSHIGASSEGPELYESDVSSLSGEIGVGVDAVGPQRPSGETGGDGQRPSSGASAEEAGTQGRGDSSTRTVLMCTSTPSIIWSSPDGACPEIIEMNLNFVVDQYSAGENCGGCGDHDDGDGLSSDIDYDSAPPLNLLSKSSDEGIAHLVLFRGDFYGPQEIGLPVRRNTTTPALGQIVSRTPRRGTRVHIESGAVLRVRVQVSPEGEDGKKDDRFVLNSSGSKQPLPSQPRADVGDGHFGSQFPTSGRQHTPPVENLSFSALHGSAGGERNGGGSGGSSGGDGADSMSNLPPSSSGEADERGEPNVEQKAQMPPPPWKNPNAAAAGAIGRRAFCGGLPDMRGFLSLLVSSVHHCNEDGVYVHQGDSLASTLDTGSIDIF